MASSSSNREGDGDQMDLFRYLEGEITYDQLQQWKSMQSSCAGLVEDSDMDEDMEDEGGMHSVRPTIRGLSQSSQTSGSQASLTESPSKSILADELTDQYLQGKISFTEFSEKMESKRLHSGEKSDSDEEADDVADAGEVMDDEDEEWVPPGAAKERAPKEKSKEKITEPKEKRPRKPKRLKTDIPRHLEGLAGEVNQQYAMGDKKQALQLGLELIRLAPNAHAPYTMVGMIYEDQNNPDKAFQFSLIAAHLKAKDVDEWVRLAKIALEKGDKNCALACYAKAARHAVDPETKLEMLKRRGSLLEEMEEYKKALEVFQQIMRLMPATGASTEEYFTLARNIVKNANQMKEYSIAINTLNEALDKYPKEASSEDINFLLEIYITQKNHAATLPVFVKHCGVRFVLEDGSSWDESNPDFSLPDSTQKITFCTVPDELHIDIRAKLVVCLICLEYTAAAESQAEVMLQESAETFGDLFLDIAEAYIEVGHYLKARAILEKLVTSEAYGKAAVWLRLGECLHSLGQQAEAMEAYKRVVELAPSHFGARVTLSAIQQQLGRHEEAVQVLSQGGSEDGKLTVEDQMLLLHKCHLLHSQGRWEEFMEAGQSLLFQVFRPMYNPTFLKAVFSYHSGKNRIEAMHAYMARKSRREKPGTMTQMTESSSTIPVDDLWNIFVKLCEALLRFGRLAMLQEVTTLGLTYPQFSEDKEKVQESEFMCLLSCLLTNNHAFAFGFAKDICVQKMNNMQAWNLFGMVAVRELDVRHSRFCLRLRIKHPDNAPLALINGHNCLCNGNYKQALAEYVAAFRSMPKDPVLSLCIGLSFIHLVSQKFSSRRHSAVVQGLAFLNNYMELRGECQESLYNMGRAMHQIGLKFAAVYWYKKALECPPILDDAKYDLRCEIAHNLAMIYAESGSTEYARLIIQQYCWV